MNNNVRSIHAFCLAALVSVVGGCYGPAEPEQQWYGDAGELTGNAYRNDIVGLSITGPPGGWNATIPDGAKDEAAVVTLVLWEKDTSAGFVPTANVTVAEGDYAGMVCSQYYTGVEQGYVPDSSWTNVSFFDPSTVDIDDRSACLAQFTGRYKAVDAATSLKVWQVFFIKDGDYLVVITFMDVESRFDSMVPVFQEMLASIELD